MARQPSVGHTAGIRAPQPPQEGNDVEPQPNPYMDHDDENPSAGVEQAPSHGVGLVAWGMVLARSSALTAVAAVLALWWRRQEPTVRQQVREWCYEAEAKRGDQRHAVDPQACCVPLWQWIVGQWQGTQLALALDATTWGTRFTVLAISVV